MWMFLQMLAFASITRAFEFMNDTQAVHIEESNEQEISLLKEMLGKPIGDVQTANPVKRGMTSSESPMKINCHHVNPHTSVRRKTLLYRLCPDFRRREFDSKANRVARVLKNSSKKSKSTYAEQKRDFMNAVYDMARAAGHLPTLQFPG